MDIIDTSVLIELISEGKTINGDASMVSAIEYPRLLEYDGFHGKIIYPDAEDLRLAFDLQRRLGG